MRCFKINTILEEVILMKKLLLKALGVTTALSLVVSLGACGGGATEDTANSSAKESVAVESAKPVKLTMWHQWVAETDPSTNSLKNNLKIWKEKHPEIEIEADGVTGEQYKTKIKTALAANEAPDIFYMWGGSFVSPYIKAGNILPIDQYLDDTTKNKLVGGTLDSCTFDGKVYSVPMFTFIANFYCNTELFAKANAKIPTNFDELLQAVKALRAAGITPAVIGEKDRWPGMYWFDIIAMRQAGNQACMEAMKDPKKFDSPDFIEAAAKLQKLVDEKAFNDNMFSTSFEDMRNSFTQGKAAMLYQGAWVDVSIEDQNAATKGKVQAVAFPVFADGKGEVTDFYGGGIDSFYINAKTAAPKEAAEFLLFISEAAGKEGFLNGSGLPAWKTDGLDTSKLSDLSKQSGALMETGKSFIPWWDTVLPATSSETHKNLIAELLAKKITPEQFCKEMAKVEPAEE